MSELISGREALIALANGEEVEYSLDKGVWENPVNLQLDYFLTDAADFRLKPHTITINGVEVPAPFTATHADGLIWYLNCGFDECYGSMVLDESDTPLHMAWRTEEEIKQVVSALRSVFKPQ